MKYPIYVLAWFKVKIFWRFVYFYSTLRMTCLKLIVAQRLQKNPYWISWLWKKYCIGLLRENYEWQVNVGTNISLSLYVTAPPRHVLKVGNVVEFITFYSMGEILSYYILQNTQQLKVTFLARNRYLVIKNIGSTFEIGTYRF